MKKYLSFILVCIICFTTLSVGATSYELQSGAVIAVNGEITELSSVIYNNTHYVPMKKVFEKLGAIVFFRESDGCSLILAPNGDLGKKEALHLHPSWKITKPTYLLR